MKGEDMGNRISKTLERQIEADIENVMIVDPEKLDEHRLDKIRQIYELQKIQIERDKERRDSIITYAKFGLDIVVGFGGLAITYLGLVIPYKAQADLIDRAIKMELNEGYIPSTTASRNLFRNVGNIRLK